MYSITVKQIKKKSCSNDDTPILKMDLSKFPAACVADAEQNWLVSSLRRVWEIHINEEILVIQFQNLQI